VVRHCAGATCTYGIDIQDVGGGERRGVVDGATALYAIRWSPDRRFLIFQGTIASRWGDYIVSTLGGTPRYLGGVRATFFAGSDSLLVTTAYGRKSAAWVWITTLDGDHRDSIRVEDVDLPAAASVAGGWIVVQSSTMPGSPEWRIVDRRGRVRDRFRALGESPEFTRPLVSAGALWLQIRRPGEPRWTVLREPIDVRSGSFAGGPDTVLAISQATFDVTADGTAVVYSEGSDQYDVWTLEVEDALRGRFPARRRVFSSTSQASGTVSPDGSRVLVTHRVAGLSGEREVIDVVPFTGGAAVTHVPSGALISLCWMPDSAAFCYAERADRGVRFVTVDARTGARRSTVAIEDSTMGRVASLAGGGWAWIREPINGIGVLWPGDARPRDLPVPEGNESVWLLGAASDGTRLVTIGWNTTEDSLRVHVFSLPDGHATRWATFFAEDAAPPVVLADGSVMVPVYETQEFATLYRLRGPGRIERVGTIPRPLELIRVSADGRRLAATTRESHGDIWLARLEPVGH